MAVSQRLRMDDIRAIIRLVCEVCELGEDGRAWRVHMLESLRRLIGSITAVCYLHDLPVDPTRAQLKGHVNVGMDPSWDRYLKAGDVTDDPMTPGMLRLLGRTFVRTRGQVCSDSAWYGSAYYNEIRRPIGSDDSLNSIVVLPRSSGFSALAFVRAIGEPQFGGRERQVIHLFHTELARLWQSPALGNNDSSDGQLSPRLRETLAHLHEGLSEKQIAARLNLSRHTVHDYVKALHRRYHADTTTELVARTKPTRRFRPRLTG